MASNPNSSRLRNLENELTAYMADDDAQEQDGEDGTDIFAQILKDICSCVRDAAAAPDFQDLLAQAAELINRALSFAQGEAAIYQLVPSFAHSDANPNVEAGPFIGDGVFCTSIQEMKRYRLTEISKAHGDLNQYLPILNMIMGRAATGIIH